MKLNETIHGFTVTAVQEVPQLKGTLYEMIHDKTQAKAFWLRRDDENKTFSIAFKTTPVDDTGVFHILEHSVLNGSDRYPVREPFVDLLKGSLQTFLNAMTFPDKTVYPVSSRNDKDFVNLMRVYLDAVFHPLAVKSPNVFRQEGWHIELNDRESEPLYKGVVFNEMKGAFSSPDSVRGRVLMHALFPDTCYGNESGGDPVHIPELTYQQFCDSHAKYYNPSNSFIALDGDMDIDQILGIINDEYLSHYTSDGDVITIERQQPVINPEVVQEFEIGPEEPTAGKAQIACGYVVSDYSESMKNIAFSVIASVLCGSNEAPLKKAILDNGLGEDVSFSMEDGIYQPFVEIDVINTDLEKKEQVLQAIETVLKDAVNNGLDREEITASLNKLEFSYKERDFGPKGLLFCLFSLDSWLYGGKPLDGMLKDEVFDQLREKISTGYFEQLIEDFLLNSEHHATVLLKPSNTLGKIKAEKEKQRLDETMSQFNDSDIDELVEMNRQLAAWQATEDTPEQQATLPALHLEDLKKQPTDNPVEKLDHDGITVLKHGDDTNGISYVSLYALLPDLAVEEFKQLGILLTLLGETATANYDTVTLNRKKKSILGSFSASFMAAVSLKTKLGKYMADISYSALSRNDTEAVSLVREILYNTTLSDSKAIRDIIRQNKVMMEQNFIRNGSTQATLRANSYYSADAFVSECVSGYEAYRYLKDLEANWETRGEEFIADIKKLYEKLFIKQRLVLSVASPNSSVIIDSLLKDLPEGTIGEKQHIEPLGKLNEGIIIPANISYAVKTADIYQLAKERRGALNVISNIMTFDYLWNFIRVRGGAYGCGFNCSGINSRFSSYRDPNPANSLKVYENSPQFLKEFCAGDPNIEKYIVGTTGDFDPLLSQKAKVKTGDVEYFSDITYQDKQDILNGILSVTRKDLEACVEIFEEINRQNNICVIGNAQAIEACRDKLGKVINF